MSVTQRTEKPFPIEFSNQILEQMCFELLLVLAMKTLMKTQYMSLCG